LKRSFVAALGTCAATFPAVAAEQANPKLAAMLDLRYVSMADLYAEHPTTVAAYAEALLRYRAVLDRGNFKDASPLFPDEQQASAQTPSSPYFIPFLWTTPDGATIRKLPDGSFLVTSSRLLANWYSEMRCHHAGWPVYFCDDNSERTMSAPDASTLIFDEVEYKRVVPAGEAPDPAAAPINTSLTSDHLFGPLPKEVKGIKPAAEKPAE